MNRETSLSRTTLRVGEASITLMPLATPCFLIFVAIAPTCDAVAEDDPMAVVADGTPWQMHAPNGRTMTIVLHPDETAEMRMGPMSVDAQWSRYPGGFCLTTIRQGERCMTLEPRGDFYVVHGPDGEGRLARE